MCVPGQGFFDFLICRRIICLEITRYGKLIAVRIIAGRRNRRDWAKSFDDALVVLPLSKQIIFIQNFLRK